MMPGRMDRRITIQVDAGVDDPMSGQHVESWATLAEVWARFVPPESGREPYTADQFAAFVDAEFHIRPLFGITLDPKLHRVLFNGRSYNIVSAVEVQRQAEIRIMCKTRAEAGAPAA